jgi:hypothetical protein
VDNYEIAILRILVKMHHPMKVSNLVDGFPDDSEDYVLQAVSNLQFLGYVSVYGSLREYILLNKNVKKEVLRIVDPCAFSASLSIKKASKKITADTNITLEDRIRSDRSRSKQPIAITGTTLSLLLIGSIIVMTYSLFGYSYTSNLGQGNRISYSSPLTSATINKIQTLIPSTYVREVNLNPLAATKTFDPIKNSSVSNLFILVDKDNGFHRVIIAFGADPPNTIYLKNTSLVLNI